MRPFTRLSLATTAALLVAGSAVAQDPVGALLNTQADARVQTTVAADQDPAEVRTTQALNAEIVAQNNLAASQEQADQDSYVAAQAQTQAAVQTEVSADQARYEADQAAYLEVQARYEAAMADWRATAAACQRGDSRRCRAGQQPAIPASY